MAWLEWTGRGPTVTWWRENLAPPMGSLAGFPAPPVAARWIDGKLNNDAWGWWCRQQGIRIAAVAPLSAGEGMRGTIGLGGLTSVGLMAIDMDILGLAGWLASQAHSYRVNVRKGLARTLRAERRRGRRAATLAARRQLGVELHDDVGQGLSTLLLRLRMALARGGAGRADLQVLEDNAQSVLEATRTLGQALRRDEPTADSIEAARQYANLVTGAAGCSLSWRDERVEASPPRISAVLASVIRESLTNIVRHARATTVDVHLATLGGRTQVTIRDDGVGFLFSGQPLEGREAGLGMIGNEERLVSIGGTFRVESVPGRGTRVIFDAPRQPSEGPNFTSGRQFP